MISHAGQHHGQQRSSSSDNLGDPCLRVSNFDVLALCRKFWQTANIMLYTRFNTVKVMTEEENSIRSRRAHFIFFGAAVYVCVAASAPGFAASSVILHG